MPFLENFPLLYKLEIFKLCCLVDRYMFSGDNVLWNWKWKRSPSSIQELAELQSCYEEIKKVKFTDCDDRWPRLGDRFGSFEVNSVRMLIEKNMFNSDSYLHFWNNWSPLKINYFRWRAVFNKIPTRVALENRGLDINSTL